MKSAGYFDCHKIISARHADVLVRATLTLNPLTSSTVATPSNASKMADGI